MKINPLRTSQKKVTVQALETCYKVPGNAPQKVTDARAAVRTYLTSGGEDKLFPRAQKLMNAALQKPDVSFRHFAVEDALVPELKSQSEQFSKAETLMGIIKIEENHAAIAAMGHKTSLMTQGFRKVNDAPLREVLTELLREAGDKHQCALAYACQLSAGALDAMLDYSSSPTGQRMLRDIKVLFSLIPELRYASAARSEPGPVSEKLARKRDLLDKYLRDAGMDVMAQWEEMGVNADFMLTHLARHFSERDLEAALAWAATPEAKELKAVEHSMQTAEQVAFFNRPENRERYTRAMRQMQQTAELPDLAGSLINLVLGMKHKKAIAET